MTAMIFIKGDLLHTHLGLLDALSTTIAREVRLEVAHPVTLCTELAPIELQVGNASIAVVIHSHPVVALRG